MFGIQEVELIWEDGGVKAPVELFVQYIIMALSKDQQEQILNAVMVEIERRNEILKSESEEQDIIVDDDSEEEEIA